VYTQNLECVEYLWTDDYREEAVVCLGHGW